MADTDESSDLSDNDRLAVGLSILIIVAVLMCMFIMTAGVCKARYDQRKSKFHLINCLH